MVDKDLFLYDLAVVAIMKCEGSYLKEWLDYHLAAGVDHFYIYDNESPDNQAEVAKPYVEAGLVTYIPFPGVAMQFIAYYDAIKKFKFQCRYMAIIDGDEFVYPKLTRVDGGGHYSITEVVDEILSHDTKAAGLAIHWNIFGSNGQETADYTRGVLDRFTRCATKDFEDNKWLKIIANPRKINYINSPHVMQYFQGFYSVDENSNPTLHHVSQVTFDKIVINHYYNKSWEEFNSKNKRGDAVFIHGTNNRNVFERRNRNDEFDDGILKYRDEMAKVYQPPDNSTANNRLFRALERNISPTLSSDTPPEFYEGKLETFLTCWAVAAYLKDKLSDNTQAKFYEETALKAILKSFDKMSVADAQLLIRELPNLLTLPYPVVKELFYEIIQHIPQIKNDLHLKTSLKDWSRWKLYFELDYFKDLFESVPDFVEKHRTPRWSNILKQNEDMPDFIDGQGNITSQELELINRPAILMSAKL